MNEKQTEKQKTTESGDEIQRQLLEAALEANRLKRLELGVAADDPKAKALARDRDAEQERLAAGEARGPEQRRRLAITLTSDAGPLHIRCTAIAFRASAEPRHRGERDCEGQLRIQGLTDWDTAEACAAIRAFHHEGHASTLEDLRRNGALAELAQAEQQLDRGVVRSSIWKTITLPALRLTVGRLLPELVASGAVSIVEDAAAA